MSSILARQNLRVIQSPEKHETINRTYTLQSLDLSGPCQIPAIWRGYGAISVKNGSYTVRIWQVKKPSRRIFCCAVKIYKRLEARPHQGSERHRLMMPPRYEVEIFFAPASALPNC